ncbi:hypothetical protein [Kribbella sp. CA-293567]|uniref:hypothetical protein n=1 Tax=Kribbella sp. CA-293567 TaxID=3002436 RepID=UPI0022DDFB96|nr:hypothetical protein [Kribbella sp. CA-293567]WBQ06897.1 hypothetical protein OX958_08885 [Kribbella sp. CA-293567]
MKSIRFAVLVATAGLVVTGCGDESDPGAGSTPSVPGPSTPVVSLSSPTPGGSGLPLTVSRTGGFAGFDDRIVVGTDGVASVTSRGGKASRCKLETGFLGSLTEAAKQVDWVSVGVTKPTVRHPDDMIVAVSANGGLTRLEDPKLKPMVTSVSKLLTEATKPGNLCKPV